MVLHLVRIQSSWYRVEWQINFEIWKKTLVRLFSFVYRGKFNIADEAILNGFLNVCYLHAGAEFGWNYFAVMGVPEKSYSDVEFERFKLL